MKKTPDNRIVYDGMLYNTPINSDNRVTPYCTDPGGNGMALLYIMPVNFKPNFLGCYVQKLNIVIGVAPNRVPVAFEHAWFTKLGCCL